MKVQLHPVVHESIDSYARYYAEHHKLGLSIRNDMQYIAELAVRWHQSPQEQEEAAGCAGTSERSPAPARGLSAVEEQHISERLARCLQVDDAIGAEICEAAYVGLKWRDNSSLEEWFPFTAKELDRLRAEKAEGQFHPWKSALEATLSKVAAEAAELCSERERMVWQSIDTAPRDNKYPLLLARFDEEGQLQGKVDFDGQWGYEDSGWESGNVRSYFWKSAFNEVEEPTHWMYQPKWYAMLAAGRKP